MTRPSDWLATAERLAFASEAFAANARRVCVLEDPEVHSADLRVTLTYIAELEAETGRLQSVIETALAYENGGRSDRMMLREKLAHLYQGDINWRPEPAAALQKGADHGG